jgi:hypothetical protein
MEAYREAAMRDFETRMVAHMGRFFPELAQAAGPPQLRELVRLGIERARPYGIVVERDVCKFVDLMLVLGPRFDEELAWARAILLQTERGPWRRLDEIFDRADALAREGESRDDASTPGGG